MVWYRSIIAAQRAVLVFCFLIMFGHKVYSQLSGTYTIGGINPDYSTPALAVSALLNQGVNGNVVFNIRPGTYSGFTVTAVPNLVYPDSVIFQSETHDSTDVVLTGSNNTVALNYCTGITLKWLTIRATGAASNAAVYFNQVFQCNVLNCILSTPNSTGAIVDHVAIKVKHRTTTPNTSAAIRGCSFVGKGCGIHIDNDRGSTQITHNDVLSTGRYSVYADGAKDLIVDSNNLNGEIRTAQTHGKSFRGNIVLGNMDMDFDFIEGNDLTGVTSEIRLKSAYVRHNNFNTDVRFSRSPITWVENNYFKYSINFTYSGGSVLRNNKIMGKTGLSFSGGCLIAGNEFYGKLGAGHSGALRIYNNLFYANCELGICNGSRVYYNNFAVGTYLYWQVELADARYNNFSEPAYVLFGSTVTHNNYFPVKSNYDAHPFNYDPKYISPTNLRATNPMLIGKGEPVYFINEDMDSVVRDSLPTIGANEICINSLHLLDSTTIVCGDEVVLKMCNLSKYSHWLPTLYLSDSSSVCPTVKPPHDMLYYLMDSTGVPVDSVLLLVENFVPEQIPDTFSINCAQMVFLGKGFNPSASYFWSPGVGLSDSTIYNPWAHPVTSTQYVKQTLVPNCGVYYDTVVVEVDPLPIAQEVHDVVGSDVVFHNRSLCADSIFLHFGDSIVMLLPGDTDIFVHHYDNGGVYYGYLVACNSFGCDTAYFTIVIAPSSSSLVEHDVDVCIYPNPFKASITVAFSNVNYSNGSYRILDNIGREVCTGRLSYTFKQFTQITNLESLSAGVYFLELTLNNRKVVKKVIK